MLILFAAMLMTADLVTPACHVASRIPPTEVVDAALGAAGLLARLEKMRMDRMDRDLLFLHAQKDTLPGLLRRYPWLKRVQAYNLKRQACR